MIAVSGTYRNGAVELGEKVDWPEGRLVTVVDHEESAHSKDIRVDGSEWDDSPEGVRQWLAWFDAAPPALEGEERERFEETLREIRASQAGLLSANEERARQRFP